MQQANGSPLHPFRLEREDTEQGFVLTFHCFTPGDADAAAQMVRLQFPGWWSTVLIDKLAREIEAEPTGWKFQANLLEGTHHVR